MAAEVVGGLIADSLALLATPVTCSRTRDALSLALFAMWIARRPLTSEKTYGSYRTETLAALANVVTLVLISLYILYEAYHRFQDPPVVMGPLPTGVAVGGVNVAGHFPLHSGRGGSLNVQDAWPHVMAEAVGSVGATVAGVLIWWRGWNLADPIASVLIGLLVLVLASSWKLFKESVAVLMQATPGHIDVAVVRNAMMGVAGVEAVHHLHVWTITSGMEFPIGTHGRERSVAGKGRTRGGAELDPRALLHRSLQDSARAGGVRGAGDEGIGSISRPRLAWPVSRTSRRGGAASPARRPCRGSSREPRSPRGCRQ